MQVGTMCRRATRFFTFVAVVCYALALTGCGGGEAKKVEPKADSKAPNIDPVTPGGKKAAPKGATE